MEYLVSTGLEERILRWGNMDATGAAEFFS
jgi:hypothetical protein